MAHSQPPSSIFTLTTGHSEIDRDHQYLHQLTNKVSQAILNDMPRAYISMILREYIEYVAIHFDHEERFMNLLKFPDMQAHVDDHDIFYSKICDFIARIERGETEIASKMIFYIWRYAFNHADSFDRKVANFCFGQISNSAKIIPFAQIAPKRNQF